MKFLNKKNLAIAKAGKKEKRKICFIITSFIHYSRNLLILEELKKRKDVELSIIIGGTALLSKYSSKFAHVREILEKEGFQNIYELYFNLEGNEAVTKAKTTGLGVIEFATHFNNINPDLVVVRGDRFEILAAAIAASYMNIPIAHIEGGDVTGSIDESVRHAVTKLSHIHFATNDASKKRIVRMGERKDFVFNFGSPDVEVVKKIASGKHHLDFEKTGSGASIDMKKGYLMVMYHPVNSEVEKAAHNTRVLLNTVHELGIPTLWFWPNFDAGAEEISHELRIFKDETKDHKIRFMRYLPPKDFIWLLKNTKCLIGNSSAGIKESSFLGIPVVNVGSRQGGRLRAGNVLDIREHDKEKIKAGIQKQIKKGHYKTSNLYSAKDTSKRIAEILATSNLYTQKKFVD